MAAKRWKFGTNYHGWVWAHRDAEGRMTCDPRTFVSQDIKPHYKPFIIQTPLPNSRWSRATVHQAGKNKVVEAKTWCPQMAKGDPPMTEASEQSGLPVLWVMWNPRAQTYDYILDRDGDQTADVDVWTTEQRGLGMPEDYRREHGFIWVRLTPEIQDGK